jgi:NAD(P)-dependent dehydrogenase (short-subunit alcohol dehydrogenase family)
MAGRTALVTGAGKGIGRATALDLAGRGYQVLAVARTEADLQSLARTAPAPLEYLVGDLSTPGGCERVAAEATGRLGQVDILVNNAGIDPGESSIWEQDPAIWSQVLAVNLDAPFHLTRLLSPGMVQRRWGRVVMVSSTAGAVGGPAMTAYCASKSGLLGLMRSAALDLAPHGVTCNAVSPGFVRGTPMSDTAARREAAERGIPVAELWEERSKSYAAGRVVEPEEVAAVIGFLVSAEASGVNGESVTVALGEVW